MMKHSFITETENGRQVVLERILLAFEGKVIKPKLVVIDGEYKLNFNETNKEQIIQGIYNSKFVALVYC